jgi:hypothetical protein
MQHFLKNVSLNAGGTPAPRYRLKQFTILSCKLDSLRKIFIQQILKTGIILQYLQIRTEF